MKRLKATLAVCMLAVLSMGMAAAADRPVVKRTKAPELVYTGKADFELTIELRQQLLQFMKLRTVLFTKAKTCVLQPGGVCVIEVPIILLKDSSGPDEYCVGLFPEEVSITGTASGNPVKTFVWSLIPPVSPPPNATFTFFDDQAAVGKAPGIIVLKDAKKQLVGGMIGDGTTSPADPTKYLLKNKHREKGKAVYIPVVVRTDDAGLPAEKVSVCGTPDPRIAND